MEEGHAGGRQSGMTVAEGVPAPRSKEAPELEAEAVKYDQTAVLELAREELQRDKVAQELARVTELLQLEDERLTHQTAPPLGILRSLKMCLPTADVLPAPTELK